jgi:phosphatidylinositol alpha-1,6-mannosyltransferase
MSTSSAAAVATSAAHRRIRVVGLFPELLGVGGVQEAGRLTAAAIREFVLERSGRADLLSLNDSLGSNTFEFAGHQVSMNGFRRAKTCFALAGIKCVRPTVQETSTIVIAGHPHLAVPAAWMKRISPRLKVIVMTHGIEVWSPLSARRNRALLLADVVLAPSRYTAEKLAEVQHVVPEKIRVLPWPLNPDFVRLASESAKLPLPENFPVGRMLLTVGRWSASERYKGLDHLIDAVARIREDFPDLQLVAVGGGDDIPRLARITESLGISDRVHFLPGLTRAQIAACYAHADVFALPSTGEGFGLVFLEAMAFAKPVLGAAVGGTLDLIQDGVSGILVPPRDPARLAAAIASLFGEESLRAQMGRAGAELVRSKYSFAAFKHQLQQILDECASALS